MNTKKRDALLEKAEKVLSLNPGFAFVLNIPYDWHIRAHSPERRGPYKVVLENGDAETYGVTGVLQLLRSDPEAFKYSAELAYRKGMSVKQDSFFYGEKRLVFAMEHVPADGLLEAVDEIGRLEAEVIKKYPSYDIVGPISLASSKARSVEAYEVSNA